ncbi:Gfo/Idh/MocA family protein [Breznakiella homolactica]|uniref:Gfo/Idh/MocA family oxidoreductase n=1 Tax=Breznakiella homolactica TaxID=2798577 RepID=A0A7T7XLJ2_9SPIR|nr:Gfo/Idh/MocA family oxidoreductase [Breznakiella homolactica]QQO08437.1 Gfo/Idh/MocA family oxidoreductase [Breznakiella homolactica]
MNTRICFIGAGKMANMVHYPSAASFNDVDIAGVCDLDENRLKETADQYNIRNRYSDYRKMIDTEKPDGVYAIGPSNYMYDIIRWCIEQKLPVFCEKPLGLNYHQAQMLTELAEKNKVITQVGHQRRSSPILGKMAERCRTHGPVSHAVCEFYKFDMNPMYGACDHIHDDCSHSVDTIRWICGGDVTGVESTCKRIGTPDINWVQSVLHFDNGSTGIIINSWASGRRVFRLELHSPGIYADVEIENKAYLYENGNYEGEVFDAKEVSGSDEFFIYGGFQKKSREFIDSVQSGTESTSSPFRDVLKTMKVIETITAQTLTQGI